MAFGIPPKFSEKVYLESITPHQFVALAVEILQQLQWNIKSISEKRLVASAKSGWFNRISEITISIEDEYALLVSASTGTEMADMGKNKALIDQFTSIFYDCKYSVDPEATDREYEALSANFVHEEVVTNTSNDNIASMFVPRKGYFVTPILVDINLLIFLLMVISGAGIFLPSNQSLLAWGANFGPVTLEGQWWRLITNCFIHIGILHVLLNMYALIYVGILLEPYLGWKKFLTAYLLTGIFASLTSLYWHDTTLSAGASGAIFGMYGVFLSMLITNLVDKSVKKALLTSILIFVGYNLVNGIKGGIDNAAHVGGLASGIVIGFCFYPALKKPVANKISNYVTAFILTAMLVGAFFFYKTIPDHFKIYFDEMQILKSREQTALKYYLAPPNTTKDQLLTLVQDSGIVNWNKNLDVLQELVKSNIPVNLKTRTNKLIHYCNLRISSYQYLYKRIREDSLRDDDSIKYYNRHIRMLVKDLSMKSDNR